MAEPVTKGVRREPHVPKVAASAKTSLWVPVTAPSASDRLPQSSSYQARSHVSPLRSSTVRLGSGDGDEIPGGAKNNQYLEERKRRESKDFTKDKVSDKDVIKEGSRLPLREAFARVKTALGKDGKDGPDTEQVVEKSSGGKAALTSSHGEGNFLIRSNVVARADAITPLPAEISPRTAELGSSRSGSEKEKGSPKSKKRAGLGTILQLQNQEEIARALKRLLVDSKSGKKAKKLGTANQRTPLHEAAEAHHLGVFQELLRLKVDGITKTYLGNTPIHILMASEAPTGTSASKYMELFRLLSRHNSMMRVLELENHRGETPLFLATVAGNHAAVDALLQSGVDYTSAYLPDIKVPSHAPAFVRVQDLINAARDFQEHIVQRAEPRRGVAVGTNSLLSRLLVATRRRSANANASAALLASLRASPPTPLNPAALVDTLKDKKKELEEKLSFSPKDSVLLAIAHSPVDESTIDLISKEFHHACRQEDSWADMQELLLTIDRLAALKEEKGRYFISFASKNELLRCLTDHVVLVNLSDKPFHWEICLFHPALSTWNSSTLRFEMLGPRKGVMQPTESVKLTLNLLSTTRIDFAQLFVVCFWEEAEGVVPHKRALYFFTRVLIQPPPDVQDLEVSPADLPPMQPDALIGTGASAQVFKVPNFLRKAEGKFIAVKRFNLNLAAGLEDFKDDYRKFKVELYISCRISHPNCVRTYGFCGTPPCLIMEYVEWNLRTLIDDRKIPLLDVHKAKIAVHIAKGMEYLHTHNVIHRDLKPANVLVTPQYTAKLADFGLSLLQDPNGELRNSPLAGADDALEGTLFYMAPELLAGDRRFSTESDVYSYGIVLLEIYKRFSLIHTLPDAARTTFLQARKEGRGPAEVSGVDVEEVAALIRQCWHRDPPSRPDFAGIVTVIMTASAVRLYYLNTLCIFFELCEVTLRLGCQYRRAILHLDLDQEYEDAKVEGSIMRMLQDWFSRLSSPDPRTSQHFREEMARSNAVERLVDELLVNSGLSAQEVEGIEKLFDALIGSKCRDLMINLRALQPALTALGRPDARAFIVATVGKSIEPIAPIQRNESDSLYESQPLIAPSTRGVEEIDQSGAAAFFSFCADARREPQLAAGLGPDRYNAEKQILDRRAQEAEDEIRRWQTELKRIQKRKAKIQKLPDAVTWVRSNLGMEKVAINQQASAKIVGDSTSLKAKIEALSLDDIDRGKTESTVEKAMAALMSNVDQCTASLASLKARKDALIVIVDNSGATEEERAVVKGPLVPLGGEWSALAAALDQIRKNAVALVEERRRNNFARPPALPSASDPPLEPHCSFSVRWVTACVSVLLAHAATPELFYSVASTMDMADLLAKMWETKPDVSMSSAHAIAGALNCYLKELSGPVLHPTVCRILLEAIRMPDSPLRTTLIAAHMARLSAPVLQVFRSVCSLVPQLLLHSAKNKLTLPRIVAVCAQWLVRLEEDTAETRAVRHTLVEYLITNYDKVMPASATP